MGDDGRKKLTIGMLSNLFDNPAQPLKIKEGKNFLYNYCAVQDYNSNPKRRFDIEPLFFDTSGSAKKAVEIAKTLILREPQTAAIIISEKFDAQSIVPLLAGRPFGREIPIFGGIYDLVNVSNFRKFGPFFQTVPAVFDNFKTTIMLFKEFDWRLFNVIRMIDVSETSWSESFNRVISELYPENLDRVENTADNAGKHNQSGSSNQFKPVIEFSAGIRRIVPEFNSMGNEDVEATCELF
jgi:hypothetical protein